MKHPSTSAVVVELHPTVDDSTPIVVTNVGQLRRILREQVDVALHEHTAEALPQALLVGPAKMAKLIDCSRTTLHRLRLEGCPAVKLGDTYKFEPNAVLEWLRTRGAA